MIGKRVEEFVDDVSRIAAIEHLLHEQLDEMGDAITKETRTFNYVASFTESKQGSIAVDEYRQEHLGLADFPDQISSSGFATLALVFHPKMRDSFEMVCEGLGELRGQPTWMVHFKQREDRPAQMHDYRVGGELYSLKLKGRAWITADKFQIVRIESELVNPVPQKRMESLVVDYRVFPDRTNQSSPPRLFGQDVDGFTAGVCAGFDLAIHGQPQLPFPIHHVEQSIPGLRLGEESA